MPQSPDLTLATLSAHSYGGANPPTLPQGVVELSVPPATAQPASGAGFAGNAYFDTNTGSLIIAYRGMEKHDLGDLAAARDIGMNKVPGAQFAAAWNFYSYVQGAYGSLPAVQQVVLTGHSLGGGLSQLVALEAADQGHQNVSGVTFGAPGVKKFSGLSADPNLPVNVRNVITRNDPIGNYGVHLGTTQMVSTLPGGLAVAAPWVNNPFAALRFHEIQTYIEALIGRMRIRFGTSQGLASPILIDIDGDGVETVAVQNGVFFDHDVDGFAELSGWVGTDDGLLVRDLNGDGRITSGAEVFGDHTELESGQLAANGYAALQDLDSNSDGKLDASDPVWTELRVWQDTHGDGIGDASELRTLPDVGIQSINVQGTGSSYVDPLR